jgi:hypothetical protein
MVLAEGIRLQALGQTLKIKDVEVAQYLESMYHQKLWNDYGILGLDDKFGYEETSNHLEEHIKDYFNSEYVKNDRDMNYFMSRIEDLKSEDKVYITDNGGDAFYKLAIQSEKEKFIEKGLGKLADELQQGFSNNEKMDFKSIIEKSQNALKEIKLQQAKEEIDEEYKSKYPEKDWSNTENPMDVAKGSEDEKDMSFWLGEDGEVSSKKIDLENIYRFKQTFRGGVQNPADRLIFSEYVFDYFGNYLEPDEDGALSYGAEYVLMGKEDDEGNLKAVIRRMLAVREIQNALAIKMSPELDMEAGSLATSMCMLVGNPEIIEVVKLGIIASWAYVESVLDVRALLRGKTIPIQKTAESFTSNLANLATFLEKDKFAKEAKVGLDYKMCLRALFLMENVTKTNERTLGLIELGIKTDSDYSNFDISKVLASCNLRMSYEAPNIFRGFLNVRDKAEKSSYGRRVHFSFIP